MASSAEIDALYESTLRPRLEALEALRLDVKGYVRKALILVGVPAAVLWANDIIALALPDALSWLPMALGFVGIFAGLGIAGFKYALPGFSAYANYRVRFKQEVAAEVFRMVCPTAQYSPLDGLAQDVFDEPGIFNTRGGFSSDDRVRGVIGQTPFEAAEVSRKYSTGGKNSRTVVVFHGLFFHLDFNKRLTGTTVVCPRGASSETTGDRAGLTEIALENPRFAEAFRVHASDEVEARYILTPGMMERIVSLQERTGRTVFLAFKNHRAYLGVHYGRDLFEPGIRETTSVDAIHEMAAHFALAEGVVEELDLNTRIWTKDVDASLLHAPDAAEPDSIFEVAAKSGGLTPETLWKAALESSTTANAVADDGGPVAAPTDTSIAIERLGDTVAVHYGLPITFWVTLAIWITLVVLAFAAIRELPTWLDMPQLAPTTAWMPEIPRVTPLVSHVPIAWFAVSSVVGGVLFLVWALRVRRVEVAADAVRVWRGLRPVPRTYARPPYGTVVRVDNAVFIGKSGGFSIINVSASPILTPEEARWITSTLTQALRSTAR